jgi:hypothetical protein
MFYVLLIIPHIAAIGGMLWFAFGTDEREGPSSDWDDGPGNDPAPELPRPRSGPSSGPPLREAEQPRPRMRPGESLADRTLPRPRREDHPARPERVPSRTP